MRSREQLVRAENRLAGFNAQRDSILAEVRRRVVDNYARAAERGGDHALEYVLNDVVYCELHRLEGRDDKASERAQKRWRDLAGRLGRISRADARRELDALVDHYCRDVVGNFNPRVHRFASDVLPAALSFLLAPVGSLREGVNALARAESHVRMEGYVDRARALCARGTCVVTPTHSSNLDSIVLGFGLHRAGLPAVTYGAGKNLFTNPFISYFMRNLGAYRVDRRLQFQLYKDVLKEYSTVLLERGFHSLFFPGGTRCRSNMLERRLKLGLLGTCVTAYRNNAAAGAGNRRLYLVPVTINYRLVLEAETMIEDYLAVTGKSRYIIEDDEFSRLGRIFEFARKILASKGAVILRVGEPMDPFGNRVDEDGASMDSRERRVDPATYVHGADGQVARDDQRDAEYTRIAGGALVRAFQRATVLMPTQLVARAIYDELAGAAGTRDVYRLVRVPIARRRVPIARVRRGIAALCERVASDPELGVLPELSQAGIAMPRAGAVGAVSRAAVDAILIDGLTALATYHTRPAAVHEGEAVLADSVQLLYYYQNRTAHIAPLAADAGAAGEGAGDAR